MTEHLDSVKSNIEDIIPRHHDGGINDGWWLNSATNWESRLNDIINFCQLREGRVWWHLKNTLELNFFSNFTLQIVPENSGIIQFNTLKIEDSFWSGNYFPNNIPANAVAIPNEFYF